MSEKPTLAAYQDALVELLSSELSTDAVIEKLQTDPSFECYREYVSDFDPDMIAVACELMGKWAKRVE